MGQARNRGTYAERKAVAERKNVQEMEIYVKEQQKHDAEEALIEEPLE